MGKYDALSPILESQPRTNAPAKSGQTKTSKSPGKSRNSEYRQISVYIRRDIHDEAQRILIGQDQDFSDVVNDLVGKWVGTRVDTSVRSIVPPGKEKPSKR